MSTIDFDMPIERRPDQKVDRVRVSMSMSMSMSMSGKFQPYKQY